MLTNTQKRRIEQAASLSGNVRLYKEQSITGKSMTARYIREWTEYSRYGPSPRSQSHMILSVEVPDGECETEALEQFNAKYVEAEELFSTLRKLNNGNQ